MRVLHDPILASAPPRAGRPDASLVVHLPGDPGREAVERFIAAGFARCFGAEVDAFMPCLVSLRRGDEILAAAGYRFATEPLFLETYLSRPIEHHLVKAAGTGVRRAEIAELGQLATRSPRHLTLLIDRVIAQLGAEGISWVTITATRELRRIFERLALNATPLAAARVDRPGIDPLRWGSYYEHDPWVIAGPLPGDGPAGRPAERAR